MRWSNVPVPEPNRLPIGVVLRTIDAEPGWWLENARRLDAAGYAGLWAWDHFVGRGDETVPVVESWTILSMAAASTSQATVGTFVANVMNRHPALLARMASTLQIASGGRFVLGIGIGGAPREHEMYGMDFPDAKERVATADRSGRRHSSDSGRAVPSRGHPSSIRWTRRLRIPSRFRLRRSSSAARRGPVRAWPAASAMAGRPCTPTSRRTCPRTSRRWKTAVGRALTSG